MENSSVIILDGTKKETIEDKILVVLVKENPIIR